MKALPTRYAVYERKAEINAEDNAVVLAAYLSPEEARDEGKRYGFSGDNYYVAEYPPKVNLG